jgi:diguanylate cyclase (GGDEF)-like protein
MHKARLGDLWRFVAYAALTILPVVWLGVVLTRTFTHESERAALNQAAAQATSITASAIQPFLEDKPLTMGPTGKAYSAILRTTGSLMDSQTVLRLRLRDVNGRVVFDVADPARLGPNVPDPEVQAVVLSDSGIRVEITHIGSDEIDGGRGLGVATVEAYVAVRSVADPRQVLGVAEIYLPYEPLRVATQESIDRLMLTIAIGLTILWLVLAGIVASVALREKRHRALAERRALHDRLTGLPGRTIYADRLAAALAAGGRTGTDVALAVLDIDRFKEVNDTLGHRNGDELLRMVADRLVRALRPGDTVARLGGDEFGIVLPGARAASVETILRRLQESLANEAELGGVAISVETSIGYAIWPTDAEDADSLQQRTDLALHTAKRARSAIVRFDDGIDEFDPQRLGLLAELRRAINSDELILNYQPKVDSLTHRVVAFEALVRWQHPTRGLLAPDEFIPIAESTGLIGPLTHWVLDTALEQLSSWHATHPDLALAVNISARNLRDDLPGWVLNRLAAHGVAPRHLVLEITETSFAMDPVRATLLLEELSAAGVRVSLDDFGQGYTSLGSLGHLPVSELKIDRGFVLSMECSEEDRSIVASVIELGHRLGLTVVAEGVETQPVADDLTAMGCDQMQGFLFSRPVPAAEVLTLVDELPARV